MNIILSELELLNLYTMNKKSVYENRDFGFLKYADSIVGKMLDAKTASILEKLNIDSSDMIFVGKKNLSSYCRFIDKMDISTAEKRELRNKLLVMMITKGKAIYVCGVDGKNDCFSYKEPELITFEISGDLSEYPKLAKINKKLKSSANKRRLRTEKQIAAINEHLSKYSINIIKSHIKAALNDFDFITRFNDEMFYQGLIYKGNTISKEAASAVFEEERYTKIIDLSRINERNAFIALYGITFFGLSLSDFYTIDGIFSMQPNRESDNYKKEAGKKVFELIISEDKDAIISALEEMGRALCKLPLVIIDVEDYKIIKTNYPLYVGMADIGSVFSNIIISNMSSGLKKSIAAAKFLVKYSALVNLYNSLYKSTSNRRLSDDNHYSNAAKLESLFNGKNTIGEL